MTDITDKAYQLTEDLVFMVTENGIAITTTEGHVHLMYSFVHENMQASKNLLAALREVYTAPDHLSIGDFERIKH